MSIKINVVSDAIHTITKFSIDEVIDTLKQEGLVSEDYTERQFRESIRTLGIRAHIVSTRFLQISEGTFIPVTPR